MFISNLLGCSYSPYAVTQNNSGNSSPSFQQLMEDSLAEKKSDEAFGAESEQIDIATLKTPEFSINFNPFLTEGFQLPGIDDFTWG